ncbi:hypothetical protein [Streptomyces radicis]|uniref:hypothetical protein n=1 Tax=Streptomyces radicis TaxID=1750517 RepID=UPI001E3AC3D3|nr:hypothetical protein [Streptomyces radicis]
MSHRTNHATMQEIRPGAADLASSDSSPPLGVLPRPDVVPYIAQWSEERDPQTTVVARRGGIGYADEIVHDRDEDGVLWARSTHRPGKGRPEFGKVHGLRQRRAMRRLLCQVCAGPADLNDNGVLWLLGEDPHNPASWPEDLLTSHPPLCLPCAATSVRLCPHLSRRYVALRVREFYLAGVWGTLYRPGFPQPVVADAAGIAYDDRRLRWLRGHQLIMRLETFTPVDLTSETG